MRIACGTDMIEISRIQEAIEKAGERFLQEIFTSEEIAYCESKRNAKYEHYAARFAAKEAIFKAISPLLQNKFEIGWKQAEIQNNEQGRPYIVFHEVKFEKQIVSIDISLSHCKSYAIANVTMLYHEIGGE